MIGHAAGHDHGAPRQGQQGDDAGGQQGQQEVQQAQQRQQMAEMQQQLEAMQAQQAAAATAAPAAEASAPAGAHAHAASHAHAHSHARAMTGHRPATLTLHMSLASNPAASEMLTADMDELDEVFLELKQDLKDNASNPEYKWCRSGCRRAPDREPGS